MEDLEHIVKFVSETNEENELNENLQSLLRSIIGVKVKTTKELWFEKEEIKKDLKYHNLILSLINKMYQRLKENKVIDTKILADEMVNIIKSTEYSSLYEQTRKLFFKVEPTNIYYYDIYYSFHFLGFKKECPLNSLLIESLKELKEYNIIATSPYSTEIESFNYDIIDEQFLQYFNDFLDSIIGYPLDETRANELLKKLKDKKRKSISKIDNDKILNNIQDITPKEEKNNDLNNILNNTLKANNGHNLNNINNNTQREDVNKSFNNIKNDKENIKQSINIKDNNVIKESYDNFMNIQDGNDKVQKVDKYDIFNTQTNNKKENNLNVNPEAKINGKTNNLVQSDVYKNEYNGKNNELIKDEKMKSQNISPIKSNGELDDDDTDFTTSKNIEKEIEKDTFDIFKKKIQFQFDEIKDAEKLIFLHKKRSNRVSMIIILKAKIKQKMKEFCEAMKSQKELLSYFCSIHENLIYINTLSSIIQQIKPPTIINIRRKFVDLIIFYIIKKNADIFILDKTYSPNSGYLDKVLKILEKQKKTVGRDEKITFVKKVKSQDISNTKYPMKIKDGLLRDLISYLQYYKKKCSNVVHIGKEGLKYYNLSELNGKEDDINTNKIFKDYENEKDYPTIKIKPSKENMPEKNNIITTKFAFKFLFDSNFKYKIDDNTFANKLKDIDKEKKEHYDLTSDSVTQSFSKMIKSLDIMSKFEFSDENFKEEEQKYINDAMADFNNQIYAIKLLISNLKNTPIDISKCKTIINDINKKLELLVDKECELGEKYFYSIDEEEPGIIVLLYFQYKLMKLTNVYQLIEEVCINYSSLFDNIKSNIKNSILKVKKEADVLNKQINLANYIQTGNDIFLSWKKENNKEKYVLKFNVFIEKLRNALKGLNSFKIDDGIIIDQINSCWLIKNKLDSYVVE